MRQPIANLDAVRRNAYVAGVADTGVPVMLMSGLLALRAVTIEVAVAGFLIWLVALIIAARTEAGWRLVRSVSFHLADDVPAKSAEKQDRADDFERDAKG